MKVHERIDGRLQAFLEAQPMFFVATAPSGPGGHVNVSPKGMAGTWYWAGTGWPIWTTTAAVRRRSLT